MPVFDESSDRTIVGPVSAVESHRLSLTDRGGPDACVIVGSPERVHDLSDAGRTLATATGVNLAVMVERIPIEDVPRLLGQPHRRWSVVLLVILRSVVLHGVTAARTVRKTVEGETRPTIA